MVLRIPDRVVVFDYGDVISAPQSDADRRRLVETAGVDADAFWPVYWHDRDALDHGAISADEYWRRIGADLGVEFSASRRQSLWVADFRSWTSVEEGTFDLLDELHAGGTRLALLSNAGFDFVAPFRHSPLGTMFERVFVSAELGLIKPDPEIYRRVATDLDIPLSAMVFIDNKPVNVDAARALGVEGHVFTSVAELRAFLSGLAES